MSDDMDTANHKHLRPVLEGVTVLDMSRFIAGPYCAALLADFGARVIRIDRLGGSEDRPLLSIAENGDGSLFMQMNRNKESIAIDTLSPEGTEVLHRLVAKSDVIIHNLPQGKLRKIGQDYETLRAINPRLIFANITAFGSRGPKSESIGFDGIGQAISGAVYLGGQPNQPMKAAASYTDYGTGLSCALGVFAALMARAQTGEGQLVESSLLATGLTFINPFLIEQAVRNTNRTARLNRSQLAAPADIYQTNDGWLIIQVLGQSMFKRWARAIGAEELIDDPRYASDPLRADNAEELGAKMSAWCAERSTAEAVAALEKAGVPVGEVKSPQQVLTDCHVKESGLLQEMPYPGLETPAPLAVAPVTLSSSPVEIRTRAPLPGEHTQTILNELHYTQAEIEALRFAKTI